MITSTTSIEMRTRSPRFRAFVELLSSMRFAISLLTVLCIASVIGSTIPQSQARRSTSAAARLRAWMPRIA
ncbi:MAG: cytochrome c biogenesis protein ResB [Burkholderiales bacterium]|nr:cytochrome c biogenesis protein ResB [Burkholderiales bacterium]